jgi:vanillate O-demethylase monooxygenase subunit
LLLLLAMPFTINLEMRIASNNNKPFLLWTTSSPVSADKCRNFMIIAHTDPDLPDSDPLDFQKIVLAEDKPVIETQPGGLSLEEVPLPTDKVSIQYRKWLRELGAAAQTGKTAFEKSLLTDVIESS